MKLRTVIAYICVPAIFTVCTFIYALIYVEQFSIGMVSSVLFGGFLFYAAPYLFWAALVLKSHPSNLVAHAGFMANTIALLLIASMWFFPGDPSGLPLQWMLYWPLSLILLIVSIGVVAAYMRYTAPNKSMERTP
jgi:hypothetical protein